ncbi:MAG: YjbQ family protein [Dehalococcoidia bacterium]
MWTHSFEVQTGHRAALVDLSEQVNDALTGLGDGLVHVFLPHATCGLALMELGSGSEQDLLDRLETILPHNADYLHRHGSAGHGRDHLLPAFIPPALVLPVRDNRLALGIWQSLVLVDTNVDNPVRTVRLSFLST